MDSAKQHILTDKQLEATLEKILNSRRSVDEKMHADHHAFLMAYIEHWETRQKVWQRFKLSFVGGIAMAIVAGLIWVGKLVIEHWPKFH